MINLEVMQEVTEKELKLAGFSIVEGPAYRYAKRNFQNKEGREVIIPLTQKPWKLTWRFEVPSQLDVEEQLWLQVVDIKHLFVQKGQTTKDGFSSLNDLAQEIHKNAIEHGWWETNRNFGEIIALIHSEASEAFEEYRKRNPLHYHDENGKPEGIAVELVDIVIRVLDFLGKEGVDIDKILLEKHEYNKTRPYKHGNKAA